uniref:E2 ubiquitin-conjugating enzyme n=1 Tax=Mimivirus LCMiAC02 TaxID=2506609 RepID=A0A4D5XF30_9VIRU|nr:MAG: ubiquitin-conjugating enzyme E2 [Mimivirus LCMiAC02]
MDKLPPYCIKRLINDLRLIKNNPLEYIDALPDKTNPLIWHFIIQGPSYSIYKGGYYIGKIEYTSKYPYAPPNYTMLTPSGRFHTNEKICITNSGFHKDQWSESWTTRGTLIGFVSIMLDDTVHGLAHITGSSKQIDANKRKLARESVQYNKINYLDIIKNFDKFFDENGDPKGNQRLNIEKKQKREDKGKTKRNKEPAEKMPELKDDNDIVYGDDIMPELEDANDSVVGNDGVVNNVDVGSNKNNIENNKINQIKNNLVDIEENAKNIDANNIKIIEDPKPNDSDEVVKPIKEKKSIRSKKIRKTKKKEPEEPNDSDKEIQPEEIQPEEVQPEEPIKEKKSGKSKKSIKTKKEEIKEPNDSDEKVKPIKEKKSKKSKKSRKSRRTKKEEKEDSDEPNDSDEKVKPIKEKKSKKSKKSRKSKRTKKEEKEDSDEPNDSDEEVQPIKEKKLKKSKKSRRIKKEEKEDSNSSDEEVQPKRNTKKSRKTRKKNKEPKQKSKKGMYRKRSSRVKIIEDMDNDKSNRKKLLLECMDTVDFTSAEEIIKIYNLWKDGKV